jgi:glucokinase
MNTMKEQIIICIDIGGTHISAASLVIDGQDVHPLIKRRGEVDSAAGREIVLMQWEDVIDSVWDRPTQQIAKILVSMPGPFDYENGICLMDGMHKYQALLYMNIRSYLSSRYGIPSDNVYFFNDAEAFLLGEIHYYQFYQKAVVGLTLGTGLGSAHFRDGVIRDLNYGSASFRSGIAEDYISTRGILDFLKARGVEQVPHIKALVEDGGLRGACSMAFSFLADALVDFIDLHILPLEPEYVVLGGSIAKAHDHFLPLMKQRVKVSLLVASFDEWNLFLGLAKANRTVHLGNVSNG